MAPRVPKKKKKAAVGQAEKTITSKSVRRTGRSRDKSKKSVKKKMTLEAERKFEMRSSGDLAAQATTIVSNPK